MRNRFVGVDRGRIGLVHIGRTVRRSRASWGPVAMVRGTTVVDSGIISRKAPDPASGGVFIAVEFE